MVSLQPFGSPPSLYVSTMKEGTREVIASPSVMPPKYNKQRGFVGHPWPAKGWSPKLLPPRGIPSLMREAVASSSAMREKESIIYR